MDRITFVFIAFLFVPYCAVNATDVNTANPSNHVTTTQNTGNNAPSNIVSSMDGHTTKWTSTDEINVGHGQTIQTTSKTYTGMSPEEFASWMEGIRSTFTNEVKRIPKTIPLTQTPRTHSAQQHTKTTIKTLTATSIDNIDTTQKSELFLSKILSSGATDINTVSIPSKYSSTANPFDIMVADGSRTSTNITPMSVPTSTENNVKSIQDLQMNNDTEEIVIVANTTTEKSNKGKDIAKKPDSTEFMQRKRILELLKMINETGRFHANQLEEIDFDNIPPEQIIELLERIYANKDLDREVGNNLPSENLGNVEVISMDKLVVVVSTISAALILFIVIMCIIYCRKGKSEPQNESMKSDITIQLSRKSSKQETSNGKVNSDTFMGIPPNNDIWRELQSLPETASSVLPESKVIESSRF